VLVPPLPKLPPVVQPVVPPVLFVPPVVPPALGENASSPGSSGVPFPLHAAPTAIAKDRYKPKTTAERYIRASEALVVARGTGFAKRLLGRFASSRSFDEL
jgi:hypothetical protein